MHTILELIVENMPRPTIEEIKRHFTSIEISDYEVFASELHDFFCEQVKTVKLPSGLELDLPRS